MAEKQEKKVKVKFNFDTIIGAYKTTKSTLLGGREVDTQDFAANDYAKKGDIREIEESAALAFLNDLIKIPVGVSGKTTQRTAIEDFIADQYIPRAELVA